jgi:radical SAM protein with 4Fe4S-binding SPASM domain
MLTDIFGEKAIVYKGSAGYCVYFTKVASFVISDDLPKLKPYAEEVKDIDGTRAYQGFVYEKYIKAKSPATLMLIPTTVCQMSCTYCYARHKEKKTFETEKLFRFLAPRREKFNNVIVYGGESLTDMDLPIFLRNTLGRNARLSFVSGMGFPRPDWQRRMKSAAAAGVNFTFSIDPPAENGSPYNRVYKLYPDWYSELIDRALWVQENLPHLRWGLRPTITKHAYNHRRLREDVMRAGVKCVPMNLEPVMGEGDQALDDETTDRCRKLFEEDVQDVISGKLDLKILSYFWKPYFQIVNPDIGFYVGGGCGTYFNRLSIGTEGEVSFCNEVVTEEGGSPWIIGDVNSIDYERYASVMQKIFDYTDACSQCSHKLLCNCGCPLKLGRGDVKGCGYFKAKFDSVIELLANSDIKNSSDIFTRRIANMRRWQTLPKLSKSDWVSVIKSVYDV